MKIIHDGDGWLNRKTTPEIYEAYKEYMKTGDYPYTAKVTDWIADKYGVAEEDKKQLGHEVYLAADMYRVEEMIALEQELLGKGFTPITKFELKEGEKIILQGCDEPLRLSKDELGWFGFPPKHTRRGVRLEDKIRDHQAYEKAKEDGRTHMQGEAVRMVKAI